MGAVAERSMGAKITVGIADLRVSDDLSETLVTYGLGSCLAIVIYDPVARVGGIQHAMLPNGSADPIKAMVNPARFVDSGLPMLFKTAYELGASKPRIDVFVIGGASMGTGDPVDDFFQIGRRNYVELKRMLWKNGVIVRDEDVGGSVSRTVSLGIATGEVLVKAGGSMYTLSRRFPRRS